MINTQTYEENGYLSIITQYTMFQLIL